MKKPLSKVAQNSSNPLFFLTAQTEKFMFQNVAYWPTVYRTGLQSAFNFSFEWENLMDNGSFIYFFYKIGRKVRLYLLRFTQLYDNMRLCFVHFPADWILKVFFLLAAKKYKFFLPGESKIYIDKPCGELFPLVQCTTWESSPISQIMAGLAVLKVAFFQKIRWGSKKYAKSLS